MNPYTVKSDTQTKLYTTELFRLDLNSVGSFPSSNTRLNATLCVAAALALPIIIKIKTRPRDTLSKLIHSGNVRKFLFSTFLMRKNSGDSVRRAVCLQHL